MPEINEQDLPWEGEFRFKKGDKVLSTQCVGGGPWTIVEGVIENGQPHYRLTSHAHNLFEEVIFYHA